MSDPSQAPKLFSDDTVSSHEHDDQVMDDFSDTIGQDEQSLNQFFEISKTVDWIQTNNYTRVALQLPDNLLKFACPLARKIEEESKARIYVLSDTSYRSCCVDFIAAEHANCDAIVHYGEACLNDSETKLPIQYIFGNLPLDINDFTEKFQQIYDKISEKPSKIFLVYDLIFGKSAEILKNSIEKLTNSQVFNCKLSETKSEESGEAQKKEIQLGREIPKETYGDETTLLIFIGQEKSALLPIWLMTFPQFEQVCVYHPRDKKMELENTTINRLLRKRLYLIERLKDANIVGLVVGTLGTKNAPDAIKRIRQLCLTAGKKLYVFAVGKLNEAKLSNFAGDIDTFILLSCPLGILLDATDFLKPIVSVFEAEIALNPASNPWFASSGWTSEFQRFLNDPITSIENPGEVDVSLISGKVRQTKFEDSNETEATTTDAKKQQISLYSAGDYFQNRTWKGLDDEYHEESTELKQGLKGVAMGYQKEHDEDDTKE